MVWLGKQAWTEVCLELGGIFGLFFIIQSVTFASVGLDNHKGEIFLFGSLRKITCFAQQINRSIKRTFVTILYCVFINFLAFSQTEQNSNSDDDFSWGCSLSGGFCSQSGPNFPKVSIGSSLVGTLGASIQLSNNFDLFGLWSLSQFTLISTPSSSEKVASMPLQLLGPGIRFHFSRKSIQPFFNFGFGNAYFGGASYQVDTTLVFSTEPKSNFYYQIGGGLKLSTINRVGALVEMNYFGMTYPGEFKYSINSDKVSSFQVTLGIFKEF